MDSKNVSPHVTTTPSAPLETKTLASPEYSICCVLRCLYVLSQQQDTCVFIVSKEGKTRHPTIQDNYTLEQKQEQDIQCIVVGIIADLKQLESKMKSEFPNQKCKYVILVNPEQTRTKPINMDTNASNWVEFNGYCKWIPEQSLICVTEDQLQVLGLTKPISIQME